jgi:acetyl-CoA C-acetyltransferase
VRRQDCGQITDGACALVLASGQFAARHAARRGARLEQLPRIQGWGHRNAGLRYHDKIARSRDEALVFPHVRDTITDAFRRAGIEGVGQLDGIETHDCFSVTEYMALDHFGITAAGAVVAGHRERPDRARRQAAGQPGRRPHRRRPSRSARPARGCCSMPRSRSPGQAGELQVEGARRFATLNIGGSCATVASFVVGVDDPR